MEKFYGGVAFWDVGTIQKAHIKTYITTKAHHIRKVIVYLLVLCMVSSVFALQLVTPAYGAKKHTVQEFIEEYDPEGEYQPATEPIITPLPGFGGNMGGGGGGNGSGNSAGGYYNEQGKWIGEGNVNEIQRFNLEEFEREEAVKAGSKSKTVKGNEKATKKTGNWFVDTWNSAKNWLQDNVVKPVVSSVKKATQVVTSTVKKVVSGVVGTVSNGVKQIITSPPVQTVSNWIRGIGDVVVLVNNLFFHVPAFELPIPNTPSLNTLRVNSKDTPVTTVQNEINRILETKNPTDLDLANSRKLIASMTTSPDGNDSKISLQELNSFQNWIKQTITSNKDSLRNEGNVNTRMYLNALYIRNLRTLSNGGQIKDIDIYAEGANLISTYWDDSEDGIKGFRNDFTAVFSNRSGDSCILSGPGCFTKAQEQAYHVGILGGSGFNPIFDDSRHYQNYISGMEGNVIFHTTGLGINFGLEKQCIWGYVNDIPPWQCLSGEHWAVIHELNHHGKKNFKVEDPETNKEDLLVSIVGLQLGHDIRDGKVKPNEVGQEIKARLGEGKKYDICKDIVPLIPQDNMWDTIDCNTFTQLQSSQ